MTLVIRNNRPDRIRITQIPAVGPPGTIENFSIDGAAPFHFTGGIPGDLVVASGIHRFYPNRPGRVGSIDVSLGRPTAGADAVFDVNLNGVSIFTTQANRPRIPAGEHFSLNNVPDIKDFTIGDYFTFDCDQRGTDAWGGAATIHVWYF